MMSQERFKAEVLPIRDQLFHIARNMLAGEQEAEDAVQEVLLKLWDQRDTLGRYDSLAAFATTVTKNHCIDRIRVRKRTEYIDDSYEAHAAPDNPHYQLEQSDTVALIEKLINQLPPLQQAIIRMKDVEAYELEEIAEITGTKADAVRANLSRARRKVREEFLKLSTR